MMQLAVFWETRGLLGALIKWRTAGQAAHVELVFGDGMSFSSNLPDGGTRFRRIDYEKESGVVLVPLPGVDEDAARTAAALRDGLKYDLWGIVKIGLFGRVQSDDVNRWFCSEVCRAVLEAGGIFGWLRKDCSPDELYIAARAWAEVWEKAGWNAR